MTEKRGLILVVEDDAQIRIYLEQVFRGDNFAVVMAENGQEALNLLGTLPQLPDLIFLDLMMPVMDGQTFLMEIQGKKDNERYKDIPVVVLSAARTEVRGNIVAYLCKPALLDQLTELAEKHCGMRTK